MRDQRKLWTDVTRYAKRLFKEPELVRFVHAAGEVDIVFVMVNTERYGGAGTVLRSVIVRSRALPAPTFAAQDAPSFVIATHELGHRFSDLADEYVDPGVAGNYPVPDEGDLDDTNVTLLRCVDTTSRESFKQSVKWAHFFDLPGGDQPPWQFEGAYYRAKGIIRPWSVCMMHAHGEPFCPVCCEEMTKSILAACGETFGDAECHKARPLKLWR